MLSESSITGRSDVGKTEQEKGVRKRWRLAKKRCKTALVTELVQAWMKNGEAGTYTGAVSIDAIKKQLLQDKEFLLEIEKSMGGTSCREVEETEPEDSDNLDMDEDMMLAGMSIFENEI